MTSGEHRGDGFSSASLAGPWGPVPPACLCLSRNGKQGVGDREQVRKGKVRAGKQVGGSRQG